MKIRQFLSIACLLPATLLLSACAPEKTTQGPKATAASQTGCPAPTLEKVISARVPGGATLLEVSMPELQVLDLVRLVSDGQGGSAPQMLPLLPDGGIDARHICRSLSLSRHTATGPASDWRTVAGRVLVRQALLLRPGVDYATAYPAAYPLIRQRAQIETLPARTYHALSWKGSAPAFGSAEYNSAVAAFFETVPGNCDRFHLAFSQTLLFPKCTQTDG